MKGLNGDEAPVIYISHLRNGPQCAHAIADDFEAAVQAM